MIGRAKPAAIQYVGNAGVSAYCIDAVQRLLQYGDVLSAARLLSCDQDHCLLVTVGEAERVAVKSGFSSGYSGEGPRALARVLRLLLDYEVDVEEVLVDRALIERLNESALTERDINFIDAADCIRPIRIYDYIYHAEGSLGSSLSKHWRRFPLVIPFAMIDERLIDLALRFRAAPGDVLLQGFRRLEDVVRGRTGLSEYGTKLFTLAFQGDASKLHWQDASTSEVVGRVNLFTGTYIAYRNPRAHREMADDAAALLSEFLLLNHLFYLESSAVDRRSRHQAGDA